MLRGDKKSVYDCSAKAPSFHEGKWVFLYKPAEKTGAARKLVRPFHGPYRVVEMDTNIAKVRRVDHPVEEPILVAIEWLCRCPEELSDEFWPPNQTKRRAKSTPATSTRRSTEQNELSESLLTEDGEMTEQQQQQLPVGELDTGGGGNTANHEDQA